MCLSIPLKITAVNGNMATALMGTNELEISVELIDEVQVGDYVLVHTGIAIEKISEEEAQENMRMLDQLKDVK
ncbi:MAG: HypC/HybG/HupF family hydrogenase formation chaperone [Bacteroidota bacterium]